MADTSIAAIAEAPALSTREAFITALRKTERQPHAHGHAPSLETHPSVVNSQGIEEANAKPTVPVPAQAQDEDKDVETQSTDEEPAPDYASFRLTVTGRLIFCALAVLTLMVSLDGTSISVALPVCSLIPIAYKHRESGLLTDMVRVGNGIDPPRHGNAGLLERDLVPAVLDGLPADNCNAERYLWPTTGDPSLPGLAAGFTQILVGRCIQGVGGGGIAVLAEVVVTDLVPLRLRGNYYGVLSAMYSLGSVLGPILGGGFSENVTWKWIFYINFPFIGLSTLLILLFFRLEQPPGTLAQKLKRVDYIGTTLFVSSLSSFLIPLTWGGVMYPWSSWRTLVPLVLGTGGLLLFTAYSIKATNPMIPHSVFTNRSAVIAFITSSLQGLILWGALYYLPLYYQAVREFGPILTGVALFPQTFTVAPSAIICGVLVTMTGRYRWGLWVGWALSIVGLALLTLLDQHTSTVAWIFLNIPSGLGLGFLTAAIVCTVQASATNRNLTVAVAMVVFFRAFGQAVGIAVGGVIFQNRMRLELRKYPEWADMAEAYSRDAAALVTVIQGMQPVGEEGEVGKENLKRAYSDSLRIIWAFLAGVAGVGLVLSLWVKKYDLNRALTTGQAVKEK
ncbi:uncharacterized protein DSM5745_03745 [Aspergillus mulundensis]|uniref:Major facilitator superfamily (MFS) profile domain-containing protein n=1 Tax=Aspergillus mulundensis TaxID=1810919 RepID=A0A3D8SLB8_9EURO|nr:Uncharacterized protein DSM5745_03745 [Aspergillus mulundensis]RDW87103.1 Uncharacterized protein DSM5745_03745 [Aspergillus mulundensis]